jgi:ubiquinol-cytochrome c reductase cytochrome c1 subunit
MLAAFAVAAGAMGQARAAGGEAKLPEYHWSFEGIFGTYDKAAAQRGLQVYVEVCSSCHGLKYVAFRNLEDIGYSEEEVKAFASQFTVTAGPNDAGQMYEREARPSDRFPQPFENKQAAMAANNGAYPPDLSVIAQARAHGADYLAALLVGYEEAPADVTVGAGQYYNKYFPGGLIAMPQLLYKDSVSYADGTEATPDQMAQDVAHFLMWAAEPHMEERKEMGIKVILFLIVFTGLTYATKKKIWQDLH